MFMSNARASVGRRPMRFGRPLVGHQNCVRRVRQSYSNRRTERGEAAPARGVQRLVAGRDVAARVGGLLGWR